MNQPKTYILPLIASIGIFLQHINLASPAYAGGFENPLSTGQTESVNKLDSSTQESKNSPVFNWKQWSKPFYNNQNICREHNGNVVCLTPNAANKVNWKMR